MRNTNPRIPPVCIVDEEEEKEEESKKLSLFPFVVLLFLSVRLKRRYIKRRNGKMSLEVQA